MAYELITYEVQGRIAVVTLNRPKVLNALNGALMEELHAAFQQVKADPQVGGVILTGSGEKALCAGADIDELRRNTPIQPSLILPMGTAMWLKGAWPGPIGSPAGFSPSRSSMWSAMTG